MTRDTLPPCVTPKQVDYGSRAGQPAGGLGVPRVEGRTPLDQSGRASSSSSSSSRGPGQEDMYTVPTNAQPYLPSRVAERWSKAAPRPGEHRLETPPVGPAVASSYTGGGLAATLNRCGTVVCT
jgi:hypothetical protein